MNLSPCPLARSSYLTQVQDLQKWYTGERVRRAQELRRRKLTGAGWSFIIDELTRVPFWYNEDTGEASYARPKVGRIAWADLLGGLVGWVIMGDSA